MDDIDSKIDELRKHLASFKEVAVAFSGGIDSALLLKVAKESCERAVGIFGISEIIPQVERAKATDIAKEIDIPIKEVHVPLLDDEEFLSNNESRCYDCKRILFNVLWDTARDLGFDHLLDGTNSDDLCENRPGNRALKELGIRTPLADLHIRKEEVRAMAMRLGLTFWDRPGNTCLSTRITRGNRITEEGLRRVELAEDLLRSLDIEYMRVRVHGSIARIEVLPADMKIIMDNAPQIVNGFLSLGFEFVTVDLIPLQHHPSDGGSHS